jgi:hypothetical protein
MRYETSRYVPPPMFNATPNREPVKGDRSNPASANTMSWRPSPLISANRIIGVFIVVGAPAGKKSFVAIRVRPLDSMTASSKSVWRSLAFVKVRMVSGYPSPLRSRAAVPYTVP